MQGICLPRGGHRSPRLLPPRLPQHQRRIAHRKVTRPQTGGAPAERAPQSRPAAYLPAQSRPGQTGPAQHLLLAAALSPGNASPLYTLLSMLLEAHQCHLPFCIGKASPVSQACAVAVNQSSASHILKGQSWPCNTCG